MNEEVFKSLTKARATMLNENPFFGVLALRLKMVENNTIPTLATDGASIYYNAEFCASMTVPLLRSAVAHEVGHCIFQHVGRLNGRDKKRWNHAGDYVINLMLKEAGFEIGRGWLFNTDFKGLTADEVYSRLPEDPPGEALCDIMAGPPDESDKTVLDNEWRVATMQSANLAKQAGKLPGCLQRFINDVSDYKVDWRTQLRDLFSGKAKNDFSWARPNRRMLSMGHYLPSLHSDSFGTVVVVTDDSGSISDAILSVFSAEIKAIRAAVVPELTIHMSCDSAINHHAEFSPGDEFVIDSKGGGGTDFRPPFARLSEDQVTPAVFVYLTDGYGPFPQEAPDYPVIWCMTTPVQGPFGTTIRIEV